MNEDLTWITLALEEAKKAVLDIPIGCVIVQRKQNNQNVLVASAYNLREESGDPTAHAEIVALRQAASVLGRWRLHDCMIYSTLEPCPMCAEAIIQARVSRLVFGAYDTKSGAVCSVFNLFCQGRIYPIPEIVGGIEEEKCRQLVIDFFKARRSSQKQTNNDPITSTFKQSILNKEFT